MRISTHFTALLCVQLSSLFLTGITQNCEKIIRPCCHRSPECCNNKTINILLEALDRQYVGGLGRSELFPEFYSKLFTGNPAFQVSGQNSDESNSRIFDGQPASHEYGFDPKIYNGENAEIGQFPFIVSLQILKPHCGFRSTPFCGGSIIAAKWVLTAAHCLDLVNKNYIRVVAGVRTLSDPYENKQFRLVREAYVHADYCTFACGNDIALLLLDAPVQPSPVVSPIQLSYKGPVVGEPCVAAGWGKVVEGQYPDILQFNQLITATSDNCNVAPPSAFMLLTETVVCAANYDPHRVTCQGDSGGPLICNGALSGIVSYGSRPCGGWTPLPGFTRVAKFQNWILRIINQNM